MNVPRIPKVVVKPDNEERDCFFLKSNGLTKISNDIPTLNQIEFKKAIGINGKIVSKEGADPKFNT